MILLILAFVLFLIAMIVILFRAIDDNITIIFGFMAVIAVFWVLVISDIVRKDTLKESLIKDNKIEYRINKTTGESYIHLNDSTMVNTFKLINKEEK